MLIDFISVSSIFALTLSMIAYKSFAFSFGSSFSNRIRPVNSVARISMSSTRRSSHFAPIKVLVPVADGTEEMEAVTIIDTLVRAGAQVVVASVTKNPNIVCSRGVKLTADCLIEDCVDNSFEAIICPGGMPGAQHLSHSPELRDLLRRHIDHRQVVAAICAAPAVVLAHHGLLEGKNATCYPAEKFMAQIENYSTEAVVCDGNIITSQGPGTALPFSLKIVEVLFGTHKASELRGEMIFPSIK